ncbi:MAG: 2-C-methyl-D-erythritol 4-phosphate cytidylyltransferase [Symbiobacteriia bacterium]
MTFDAVRPGHKGPALHSAAAVIPAAGQGRRMGGETAKQFLPLRGLPILVHTLRVFEAAACITEVVLVVAEEQVAAARRDIVEAYGLCKVGRVVAGGDERQDSVYLGLQALAGRTDLVVVHDAARPLLTPDQLDAAVATAAAVGPLVVAVPVKDTVKVVDPAGVILETPDRRRLWAAQTPQIFPLNMLLAAHETARRDAYVGTDDASLVERLGQTVQVLLGSPENLKVTTPEDLLLAERILERRAAAGAGRRD